MKTPSHKLLQLAEAAIDACAEIEHHANEMAISAEDLRLLIRKGALPPDIAGTLAELCAAANSERCCQIAELASDAAKELEALCE